MEASEPDDLWVAPAPALPPALGLGRVLAVEGPREHISKRLGYICLALVAVAAILFLVNVLVPLIPLAVVGAPFLYLYLAARRTFVAVGDGWWFTRDEAWGRGRWSTFETLESVRLRLGANRTPYLEFRSPRARGRFGTGMSGAVTRELARQALSSGADIDHEAESILLSWSGDAAPVGATRRSRVSNRSPARTRRVKTGGWRLLVSGTMLVVAGPWVFMLGWHDVLIRHDPAAVRVVATVDRVERSCGRGGCRWSSYGHFMVAGHSEEGVAVASGRKKPTRDSQTILVNPARPADVVNVDESPSHFLALGIAALVIGGLFLVLWVKPMLRERKRQDTPSS